MRKLLLAFFLLPLVTLAQYRFEYGYSLGVANYLGDIGGKEKERQDFVRDIHMSETKLSGGFFIRQKITPILSLKAGLALCRITGADRNSINMGRHYRNLSFRNDILELSAVGQAFFYELNDIGNSIRSRSDFRAYGYAGLGVFYHNPKALKGGIWYQLRELRTEGQLKPYSPMGICIPTGIGMYFTVNRVSRITFEMGWRTTFTDYLDDISTTYADPKYIPDAKGVELANRTGEITTDEAITGNYLPGLKRGDPTHNDSYLVSTVSYSTVIKGYSQFYRSKHSYLFGSRKYKKRRIRAKF